jgi:multicomponent Na+:H+ antiporter subunit C
MTLVFALVVGVLFAAGAYLLLKADLFRVVVGTVLISNAAVLTLVAAGLVRGGRAPIEPFRDPGGVSDPLVQALALTAIVIGFAVTALLLSLAARIYASEGTVDLDQLSEIEIVREEERERAGAER